MSSEFTNRLKRAAAGAADDAAARPGKKVKTSDRFIPAATFGRTVSPKKAGGLQDFEDDSIYNQALANEIFPTDTNNSTLYPQDEHQSPRKRCILNFSPVSGRRVSLGLASPRHRAYRNHVEKTTQALLASSPQPRKHVPELLRVLDGPELLNEFYINSIDWSAQNVVATALGSRVYTYDGAALCSYAHFDIIKRYDLPMLVTGVAWDGEGSTLAVGTQAGAVHLYDIRAEKHVRTLKGHQSSIVALSWAVTTCRGSPMSAVLSSGSLDQSIQLWDSRAPQASVGILAGHCAEVYGLAWNRGGSYLASGGNDNKVMLWDARKLSTASLGMPEPLWEVFHDSAVKALAWNPQLSNCLASGGGYHDGKIRLIQASTGDVNEVVDTGSEVSNLIWSRHTHEIVSAHGPLRPEPNQTGPVRELPKLCIWKSEPTAKPVWKFRAHSERVEHLTMSPDGTYILAGSGADETLRLWRAFGLGKVARDEELGFECVLR